jgi:RNA polymerase sigma-70 factor (ECF subfamily)
MATTMAASAVTDDEVLFTALQAGGADALRTLIERHDGWIRSIVFAVLGRPERVDDVTQQVWTTVWQQADRLREPARWRAWLARLTRNAAIDAGRDEARRRKITGPGDPAALEAVAAIRPSPVEQVTLSERQRIVLGSIQGLPAIYREPFMLRHLEEWSYQQIAEHLDAPIKTVETRLVRARRLLREALENKV